MKCEEKNWKIAFFHLNLSKIKIKITLQNKNKCDGRASKRGIYLSM